jgi:hypothetical protein
MPSKRKPKVAAPPLADTEPMLTTGTDAPMTPAQKAELRQLAVDAYELDAYGRRMTQRDAEIRIAMLRAKLKLLSEPPHTA